MAISAPARERLVARGRRLEYITLAWDSVEATASLAAGVAAGSIALVAFGLDSVIEAASGATLLWRLRQEHEPQARERAEQRALRIVGWLMCALAVYVAVKAVLDLWSGHAPTPSIAGLAIATAALIAMPLIARAKRRVGAGLGSAAMNTDARQADFCAWLSGILLIGLILNAALGWWWADPAAALIMVPIIAREGVRALRGEGCCGC